MMSKHCKKLVEQYADGRPICNCGQAYGASCDNGCSANMIAVKEEIAEAPSKIKASEQMEMSLSDAAMI